MSRFVEAADFLEEPFLIPNQEESKGFAAFLTDQEEALLKKLLGLDLYNEFIEGLETSGEVEDKWVNLRDGAEYTNSSRTYEYLGLKKLLKPAIYSEWVRIGHRRLTTSSVITNNGQNNTTVVDPTYEIVTYWNDYVVQAGVHGNTANSLYGFMMANEEDYDALEWCNPQLKNQFNM